MKLQLTISNLVSCVGLAGLMLMLPMAAGAHALLVKSEPSAGEPLDLSPQRLTAWYSQELESRMSSMRVYGPDGSQVDNGDGRVDLNDPDHLSMVVTLPEGLPPGDYSVRWNVVSAEDGDPTEGEFSILVGGGTASAVSTLQSEATGGSGVGWLVGGGTAAGLAFLLVAVMRSSRQQR